MIEFVDRLNTTNFRIFVTVNLFVVTVLFLLACIAIGLDLEKYEFVIGAIFTAEFAAMGVDYLQYGKKRTTDYGFVNASKPVTVEQAEQVEIAPPQGDVHVTQGTERSSTRRRAVAGSKRKRQG